MSSNTKYTFKYMTLKLISFVLVSLFLESCTGYGQLSLITKLPKKLNENSGIVQFTKETAWFIEDSGNSDNLYKTDFNGNIIKHLDVKNQKNIDWEDLTKDKIGNLYIGDFGNNDNKRKNLAILKLPNPENEKGTKINAKRILFNYPEQKEYPPKENEFWYDAEAFFHHQQHLYIFTKNRATPFTGETLVYKIPDTVGKHEAKLIDTVALGKDWATCRVTSAAISPDSKTIVLLGNGKLWLITDFFTHNFSNARIKEIDLGVRTQLESVCFTSNNMLLLSDEVRDKTGGNLYSFKIK